MAMPIQARSNLPALQRRAKLANAANLLTLSRLPLSAAMFIGIESEYWWLAFAAFAAASLTDALDGWVARRFNLTSAFGRTADPLIDKVMILGAFVFLMAKPESRIEAWMVVVLMAREFLVTGIRGHMEALGVRFGADWFGKLKMILQCVLLGFLLLVPALGVAEQKWLTIVQISLIYLTLAATVGSGIQYLVRAGPHLNR